MNPDDSSTDDLHIFPSIIKSVGAPVKSEEIQPKNVREWALIQGTKAYLDAWKLQQKQERLLRKGFATWIFRLLTGQIIVVFGLVILDGFGCFTLKPEIMQIVFPATLAEITAMAWVVVKYLFAETRDDGMISRILGKRDK